VADLYGNNQRRGFLLGGFIQSDVLLHTVVFDNEVFDLKTIRNLSGFRPDEGRNQNDVRFGSYCRKRLLGVERKYDTEQDRQFKTATSPSNGTIVKHESQLITLQPILSQMADVTRTVKSSL
jgi:hypothetical protein